MNFFLYNNSRFFERDDLPFVVYKKYSYFPACVIAVHLIYADTSAVHLFFPAPDKSCRQR